MIISLLSQIKKNPGEFNEPKKLFKKIIFNNLTHRYIYYDDLERKLLD